MMSIRGRLLALAIGGVLPLLLVGLTALWFVWSEKRNQLNESLEQQSELLAVVFDRWLESGQAEREGAALRDALHGISLPDRALVTTLLESELPHRLSKSDRGVDAGSGPERSREVVGSERSAYRSDRDEKFDRWCGARVWSEPCREHRLRRHGWRAKRHSVRLAWRQLKGYAVVGLVIVFCTVAGLC
jgi:hypothetical protein